MPTYEYKCTGCNHEWEAEQSIKEPPISTCPSCAGATAKRQISRGGGFILRGGSGSNDSGIKPVGPMTSAEKQYRDRFTDVSGIKTY